MTLKESSELMTRRERIMENLLTFGHKVAVREGLAAGMGSIFITELRVMEDEDDAE
jgi:hypothetical protein